VGRDGDNWSRRQDEGQHVGLAICSGADGLSAALLALGALILVAVPVFLRRPVWAVFTYAFLLLLHANLVLSSEFKVDLADPMLFGSMLGLAAVYPLLHGDTGRGMGRFLFAVGLWVSAVLNSYIWSTAACVSVDSLQSFLPNILYGFLLLALIADRDRLFAALWGVVAAAAVLSTLTIVQVTLGLTEFSFFGLAQGNFDHIAGRVDAIRPTGPVRDPNYYCQILVPGFALALGLSLGGRNPSGRVAGLLVVLIILVAIMLTASRGGLLAAALAATSLLMVYRKLKYVFVILVPVFGLLFFVPSYLDRVTSLITSVVALTSGQGVTETSVSGRLAEMEAAAILFAEHPISGIGFGMFEGRYQEISANYDMVLRGEDRSAHSLFLETAAEQGAVGFAALLFLLGASLRSVQLAYREAVRLGDPDFVIALWAMTGAAVGLFISAIFLHDAYAQHFWLVLALLFAAERVSQARSFSPSAAWIAND
jgi:putative inorganic carbon (hco3(-)) transporter